MDYLVNLENKSWLSLIKGFDIILDPGYGIIARGEEKQAIVLNPKVIQIIEHNSNKDNEFKNYSSLLKQVASEMNGKFYFKNNIPTAELSINDNPVKIELIWGSIKLQLSASFYKDGFWMTDITGIDENHQNTAKWLKMMILYATKDAESAGLNLYWDFDKVKKIINTIIPRARRIRQRVKDSKYHLWYSHDGSLSTLNFMMNFEINHNDELKVYIGATLTDKIDIEKNFEFSNSITPEQVAKEIRDYAISEIYKQGHENGMDDTNISKYREIIGLDFKP